MSRRLSPLVLLLGALACAAAAAQNEAETTLVYPCRRTARPVAIDGKLDPAEWDAAVAVSGFTITGSDALAPQQVVMRLLYDDKHLYIGVKCLESNMKGIKAPKRVLDGEFWLDDSIELFIDANHDHASYWQFAATASAARYDNMDGDSTWNSKWRAAAQRDIDSWSVEAAVPFADLKLPAPAPGTLWGFNLCRERQAGGKLELYNWADVQRVFKNAHLFGHLYFVATDWKPTTATVAPAASKAEGSESVVYARDGHWRVARGAKPEHLAYRTLLRRRGRSGERFMAELRAVYREHPRMALRKEFDRLNTTHTQTKAAIAGKTPIGAEAWAKAALFLDSLPAKAEDIYWRVQLAVLNETLDQPDKEQ